MNQPLVSVIVPTKNSSQFLDECLLSIKNQTYSNIEIITVIHDSTDNSLEILKKYSEKIIPAAGFSHRIWWFLCRTTKSFQ